MKATAVAHANIALVKYWGKRDDTLVLPQASSLSVALDKLCTTTTVELDAREDSFELDGAAADASRVRALLDAAGIREKARVVTRNDFPTAAGLASSASGFAALAVAASAAAGQQRTTAELSALARLGSGSAARSVPGGWAVWESDSARQVFPESHWDLRFCVAICATGPKTTGSRDGMWRSRETSPYHTAWIEQCRRDLPQALAVLKRRDLPGLGALAERNALRMHADAMAADPPLLYWEPATVACLRELQSEPRSAWPTIDAGPHVVAICAAADAQRVETRLRGISGVKDVIVCAAAGGARLVP
jgi:diphosphomevalonate decarboxylase